MMWLCVLMCESRGWQCPRCTSPARAGGGGLGSWWWCGRGPILGPAGQPSPHLRPTALHPFPRLVSSWTIAASGLRSRKKVAGGLGHPSDSPTSGPRPPVTLRRAAASLSPGLSVPARCPSAAASSPALPACSAAASAAPAALTAYSRAAPREREAGLPARAFRASAWEHFLLLTEDCHLGTC